jgi:hypothetical protein
VCRFAAQPTMTGNRAEGFFLPSTIVLRLFRLY